ncbi:leucyl aminopeptidase family protein [Acetobacter sp. TBRC 12305]|uniref:Leucyl aminopeptidase family protein n=1 Tax=Acetobacter garciniae TaxID=2817435 RepID=A0A939HHN9_9PROT|nr:leucyl aminopeptidase family protein [Acetobacter garciniae]MBO1324590.1 leucyl aminopeptidase family protein [Acetobacter garciniae]MBX0344279.1 leucyl aminopeptidase family protein [Acetobacter garciniae]
MREPDCLSVPPRRKKSAGPGTATSMPNAVYAVRPSECDLLATWISEQAAAFAQGCGFTASPGQLMLVPGEAGGLQAVLGIAEKDQPRDPFVFGVLARDLPGGDWRVETPDDIARDDVILGFCLGAYRYGLKSGDGAGSAKAGRSRNKAAQQGSASQGNPSQGGAGQGKPRLVVSRAESEGLAVEQARSIWLARDLINMPANLLGPSELAQAARDVLEPLGAQVEIVKGAALAKAYPLVAHVGMGSERGPRVVVARWQGSGAGAAAPLLSLVGKGVCFDSGGYDLKPSSGMLRMKKDMGGAATVLALARLVMARDLPVRLELRLGCVENSVSGRAMRPLDVVTSRAGLSVEIGNTDAEGRLVLCDLLHEACEHDPALLLDVATLTGAARVALGPDLPALFCNDDATAQTFLEVSVRESDPLWRLPLWPGYAKWLSSPVADLNNIASRPMAGAITAGLFLARFVKPAQRWVHIDSYAWNDSSRPGRPEGGDSPGIRAFFTAVCTVLGVGVDPVS